MEQKRPKAYSYIRMSSELQLKGDSLRRQLERTEEFAAKHNLELADPIQDLGVSAFRGDNVEFGNLNSFLELIRQGKVERGTFLVVESLDRLSRANVSIAFMLLMRIVSSGVNVATLSDGQIYTSETLGEHGGQIFMALGSMLRAHDESRVKSQRIVAAWANKKKLARAGVRKLTKTAPLWLRVSDSRDSIAVIPGRAAIVQEIFELTRDGWGAFSIARRLNERKEAGWGARPGKDLRAPRIWHESYIKKILINRAVLGEFQPCRTEFSGTKETRVPDGPPIIDYYPRVVSDELFYAAHAAMDARRGSGRGRKGELLRNMFSGLLYCGHCGRSMRFINKGSAKRGASQWLACSNQRLKGGCRALPWRYRPFEEAFVRYLKYIDISHLLGGERREDKLSALREEVRLHVNTFTSNEAKLANLTQALAGGASKSIADEIRRIELEQLEVQSARERAELQLSSLLNSELTKGRDEVLRLLNRIAVRRDRRVRVDERRLFSAEIRRVVKRVEMFSGVPCHPWDAETEPEMELLSKMSEHALREKNHAFRVEYLSGESDMIEPYRARFARHGCSDQIRDSLGRYVNGRSSSLS